MSDKDLYKVLGVANTADTDEIKKAFRKLARRYHPDVNPGNREAEARFKEVSEAHEVLSDPEKRKIYDEFGYEALQSGFDPERARAARDARTRSWGSAADASAGEESGGFYRFEDIFGDMFSERQPGPQRGTDIEASLEISLLDAVRGTSTEFEIDRAEACSQCGGSGRDRAAEMQCPDCSGRGRIRVGQGPISVERLCPRCGGVGRISSKPCPACGGRGQVGKRERLRVHLPAGVDTGSRIRVAGKGAAGYSGGPAGDLYIVVRVAPHPRLERRGQDLYMDVPITVGEAVLGASIDVPTPHGQVRVKVPPASQSGKLLRVRSHGVSAPKGAARGDLYLRLMIQVPTQPVEAVQNAAREMDAHSPSNVRSELRL
jgi:molecular chaperone DnaJ